MYSTLTSDWCSLSPNPRTECGYLPETSGRIGPLTSTSDKRVKSRNAGGEIVVSSGAIGVAYQSITFV